MADLTSSEQGVVTAAHEFIDIARLSEADKFKQYMNLCPDVNETIFFAYALGYAREHIRRLLLVVDMLTQDKQ